MKEISSNLYQNQSYRIIKRKNVMKTDTIIFILCIAVSFFVFACSSTSPDSGNEPELLDLQFTHSEYSASQALVLRAAPNPDLPPEFFQNNPVTVQLTSSNGEAASAQFSPWTALTNQEMVEAIKDGPGRTAVRIKEADQESARNSQGELIRSEQAMKNYTEWVEAHDKLTISWVAQLHPDIGVEFLDEPDVNIVQEIQNHENVEFMEPVQYGEYLSTSATFGETEIMEDIVSVILPGELFQYSPGETITAEVQQADGTHMKASVQIVD